jgi:molybdate transport system substrate-binding protein
VRRALVAAALLAAACSPAGGSSENGVTVFAASSLQDVFGEEAAAFGGGPVTFSFAGSQQLAAQVGAGAPADVLATADEDSVRAARAPARVFARNLLQVAVRPGNPKRVRGLADLGRRDLVVVLAAPRVPAGRYAAKALARAHVTVRPASLEDSVRGALTKVELGEADAALVYVTDVRAARPRVTGVDVPAAQNEPAAYYAAPVRDCAHPDAARQFVAFLLSARGQAVLRDAGFQPP